MSHPSDLENYQLGDKVRVRSGQYATVRGIVLGVSGVSVEIECEIGIIKLEANTLTNYSLAARRAWEKMPKKAGRPKSETQPKKAVSIRIEKELWERMGEAVSAGLIVSREQAINDWIREHIQKIFDANSTS